MDRGQVVAVMGGRREDDKRKRRFGGITGKRGKQDT